MFGAARSTAPKTCTSSCIADDRAQRVALVCVAGVEVDDREAGKVEAARAGSLPTHVVQADLPGRAVVVDEVGLLGLVEADLGEHQPDLLEGAVDAAGPARQLHVRDVEGAERARAPGAGKRSKRGVRVGSWLRHQASNAAASPTIRGAHSGSGRALGRTHVRDVDGEARTLRRAGGRRATRSFRTTAWVSRPARVAATSATRPPASRARASHRQTTRQSGKASPAKAVQPPLGPGPVFGVEVALHRGAIRPGDPARVGREALLASSGSQSSR